ncbi:MAG: 23S rRNA (uracil(1939)-C(5))-methyltransferase RlmD [Clostridiales bacterium]|nr:23S rRNA (uracil(1939)-C(5))-methyltransferase RlmD [Clostridiales bacterium]
MPDSNTVCKINKRCSGCHLQNLTYAEQLKYKQSVVNKTFLGIIKPKRIIGMENPVNYRNKATTAYSFSRSGEAISGVYQSKSGMVIPTDKCAIVDEDLNNISNTITKLFASFKLKPFNYKTKTGYIRSTTIRKGYKTNEISVLITAGKSENRVKPTFINALIKAHPQIKTVVLNCNDKEKLLPGERIEVLLGNGSIISEVCGYKFNVPADAFFQVNSSQAEILYSKAIEYAELTGKETVMDAYCGSGIIGLLAARSAKSVVGVEKNPYSIQTAKENAKLNNVKNIEFVCDDAGKYASESACKGVKINTLFVDPPRAGCSKEFLESVCVLSPQKIVYVSCNIETLARDIRYLKRKGYIAKKLQPVDMFPFTKGIEAVALVEAISV